MRSDDSRYLIKDQVVVDNRSSLMWPVNAALGEFPMSWNEALGFISDLNQRRLHGYADWRLPNRRELFSLVSHTQINPSLPKGHPFVNVFSGYYWTGTTCSRLPDQAWYLHLGGARVFKGMKRGFYMVWPVRTADANSRLPYRTGQQICYSEDDQPMRCSGDGQDGDLLAGRSWPQPRFELHSSGVLDRLTGLLWDRCADRGAGPVVWGTAGELVTEANQERYCGHDTWRLPTVREIESLCDMGSHSPALPVDHPFENVQSDYWTSSTSHYDPGYAWVLYLQDGAVGVGFKTGSLFFVWLVSGRANPSPMRL